MPKVAVSDTSAAPEPLTSPWVAGSDQRDSYALRCASDRGRPLVTAGASRYAGFEGLDLAQLP